jgi:hypothetical protein
MLTALDSTAPDLTPPHGGSASGDLVAPREWEGDCPNRHCQGGPYPLNDARQLPEHNRALHYGRPHAGRCPCSGWQARNVRVRRFQFLEGVRYL